MLYQNFKRQLFAIGVTLAIICSLIIGAFVYNYFLSRKGDRQHQELINLASALNAHTDYMKDYLKNPESISISTYVKGYQLGELINTIVPATYEESVYYNEVVRRHDEFHRLLPTASLSEIMIASQELNGALNNYNIYLAAHLSQMEIWRTRVVVAVALPGLFLVIFLLAWLYYRMYRLIQYTIVIPLRSTIAILSKTGLYTTSQEDEPEAIYRAVQKASRIIEMDNSRRRLYPFWNSVFTEEELLTGSLELFGENQLVASAAFYHYDSFTDQLTLGASYAFPSTGEQRVPYGVGPIGEAAKRQRPVLITGSDFKLSLGFAMVHPAVLGFYPVGTQQLYGVLAMAFQTEPTPEQLNVAEFFAAQLGIVMDRVRQLDDLKKMTWELGNRTRALNKELRYKDSILNSSADGIAILSVDGVINLFSKGAEAITGYSTKEAIASPCCNIFGHRDQDFVELCNTKDCANCLIATDATPITGRELYIRHKDGYYVPILLSATPLFNERGEVTEILQIFKDVTDLRNTLTQLEQADRSKTEFLATMSHELRTPLNAVLGFAELLQAESFGPLNDRQKRYTANILTAGKHLLSLINDILDITRVESGKVEWEYAPLDITQVFGSAVSLLREKAVQNQLKLSLEIETGFKDFVGDERKLKQILYNLINNAVKFTPSGGQVGVRVAKEGENMLITVWDTGIGIPMDKRQIIFEPFFQVDNYLTRSQQGSGLGLALVKKMLDLAGGRIWVEDEKDKSTVIKILLPPFSKKIFDEQAEIAAAGGLYPKEVPGRDINSRPAGKLAVLVEDDRISAELLETYLKDIGYNILTVPTGEEGMAAIESEKPELIVLDILLPGMNGWEMLAEIKSRPSMADIPVIVVSILEERKKGLALGAADYLTKPIDKDRLDACVRKVVCRLPGKRCQALVIDDDPRALELFNSYLSSMAVDAFLATDSEEGLNMAKEVKPDIIFLDLIMPKMDGFTFLEQKEGIQELKDIPVVVVTSKSLTNKEKEFLGKRVEHVARKSEFDHRAFKAVVEKIVGGIG